MKKKLQQAIIRWLLRSYLTKRRLLITIDGLGYYDTSLAHVLWLQDQTGTTETRFDFRGIEAGDGSWRRAVKQRLNDEYGKLGK